MNCSQEPEITRELRALEKSVDSLSEIQGKLHEKLRPILAVRPEEAQNQGCVGRICAPVNTQVGSQLSALNDRIFQMERYVSALIEIAEI